MTVEERKPSRTQHPALSEAFKSRDSTTENRLLMTIIRILMWVQALRAFSLPDLLSASRRILAPTRHERFHYTHANSNYHNKFASDISICKKWNLHSNTIPSQHSIGLQFLLFCSDWRPMRTNRPVLRNLAFRFLFLEILLLVATVNRCGPMPMSALA